MAETRLSFRFGDWSRSNRIIAVSLAAVVLVTWLAGVWDTSRLEDEYASLASNDRVEAVSRIQAELDETYADLRRNASDLASRSNLILGLRLEAESGTGHEMLVHLASDLEMDPMDFLEIYDPTPSVLAWDGAVFPIDPAVSNDRFLLEVQESVVLDGAKRSALVVWVPVVDGSSIVGAVRMGRMVESRMPIKNEYLRDFTWGEEWTRRLGQTVEFEFGTSGAAVSRGEGEYSLRSPADEHIGSVVIVDNQLQEYTAEHTRRYEDILSFWMLLGIIWLIALCSRFLWRYPWVDANSAFKSRSLLTYLVFLALTRWVFLFFSIPARWQTGKAPLAPLFDPQHLASVIGLGSMRTIGDLFITSIFVTLAVLIILRITADTRLRALSSLQYTGTRPGGRLVAGLLAHQAVVFILAMSLFQIANHTVLDSTLDFFERSGLMPERLVLVVFGALLLLVFSFMLFAGRALWLVLDGMKVRFDTIPSVISTAATAAATSGVLTLIIWIVEPINDVLPAELFAVSVIVAYVTALVSPLQPARRSPIVALRRIVPLVVITSLVLFPMLEMSSTRKVELQMREAGESFLEDRDARIMFAISQVLDDADADSFTDEIDFLINEPVDLQRVSFDSLAESISSGFLLSALASYDVTLTLFSESGGVLGRYSNLSRRLPRAMRDREDQSEFQLFRAMYSDFGDSGPMIEKLTGSTDQNRFRYAGFEVLSPGSFVLIRAEQRALTESAGTPFPKVLSPAGYYGDRFADLSIAEFREGILVRTEGKNYGRTVIDEEILSQLQGRSELWSFETVRDRDYQTYYRVRDDLSLQSGANVTAVRRRTTNVFDQLYHLLRIIVAGLLLALPIYLAGLAYRWRRPSDDSDVRHFRDKVLNAFFSVGIITVVAMGFVGLRVVTGENERAIESWLRQHLERVEQTLELETQGEELPYRVLNRISVDSLAARVGLDLIVYHNLEVEQASRPELIRDRLIERRLPIEAYEELYFDGFAFATVSENLGSFSYTAGYRALSDEQGTPHYVVSIPTLPEQERIEEERARTVAYLFGALLLLVLVVMTTASLLANALTRPIAQLRAGLQAVAAGHFERIAKMESGDEIADLVDSFNTMQDQLEESRSLLSQQERQLAWREMARQVAHEIKNPLTPMKLSIQHLRAAFGRRSEDGSDDEKFSRKFSQTTATLIEQIDTLARIANEFSSFGRMPTHIREEVDLNKVVSEAVELMQAEENVLIETDLHVGSMIVHADREALRRVYVNFLKNAIQSFPEDRIAEVTVVTGVENHSDGTKWVLASVTDNGSGIPRNLWEKIFVPSFSTKTSGTGLGLAIARKTIENMDGEIGFDTQFNKGTTFWIKVPFAGTDAKSAD